MRKLLLAVLALAVRLSGICALRLERTGQRRVHHISEGDGFSHGLTSLASSAKPLVCWATVRAGGLAD